jgi:hypothetical protein
MGESADWKCPKCTHRSALPVPCPTHPGAELIHPWSAFECCDVDPRQNGKSEKLVVRQLAGLFVLEEPLADLLGAPLRHGDGDLPPARVPWSRTATTCAAR